MAKIKYDFSGWATKFNIKCSDGRTIKEEAFKEDDGVTVPLVWNHNHTDADNVLGHAVLENRKEGVYAYCSFNDTERGKLVKELVKHGDISALSIFANKLKQLVGDVIHGKIREVSLVLAGANPGAFIETVLAHGENGDEESAMIYNSDESLELFHAEGEEDRIVEEKNVDPEVKVEPKEEQKEKTVQEVVDTMNEEQKNVMYALIGQALDEKEKDENPEDKEMKHNAFDKNKENLEKDVDVLEHSEFLEIIAEAKKGGSVKDAFLQHGIENVDNLFPEVQAVNKTPEMIQREMTWVGKVMSNVHHTPFSRIKSTTANITADEARAKGYVKGAQKVQEVITALKRTTTPQTVYKLQKMDRDDVIDITEFDVIAWLKAEMRVMLDEEIARAILIGDGRAADSADKISATNIRPILGDTSVYTVPKILIRAAGASNSVFAKAFIDEVIKARKDYKGSGNPTLFTTEDLVTDMLLIEDTNGRKIYKSIDELATTLRAREIVTVPVAEGLVRVNEAETYDFTFMSILVNLADYNIGADKGGAVSMFDDFDINYNKLEYLIETRCSGALTKPFSAISFEEQTAHVAG